MMHLLFWLDTIQKGTDTNIKNEVEKGTTWTEVYLKSNLTSTTELFCENQKQPRFKELMNTVDWNLINQTLNLNDSAVFLLKNL